MPRFWPVCFPEFNFLFAWKRQLIIRNASFHLTQSIFPNMPWGGGHSLYSDISIVTWFILSNSIIQRVAAVAERGWSSKNVNDVTEARPRLHEFRFVLEIVLRSRQLEIPTFRDQKNFPSYIFKYQKHSLCIVFFQANLDDMHLFRCKLLSRGITAEPSTNGNLYDGKALLVTSNANRTFCDLA